MDELTAARVPERAAAPLRDGALGGLPAGIGVPRYDRAGLAPGIVHVGVGNFHRAHQAWYLHRLMQEGRALDWAIVGAGVRPYDRAMREKLEAQDFLTTLIELAPSGASAEIVGSMIDYLPVEPGNGPLVRRLAEPGIRIVSLTVTEGGYYADPRSGGLDSDNPDIRHDAQAPASPKTAFGAIVAALRLRRDAGHGPFTLLCCDNLQGNGGALRRTVVSLARLGDPALADWIEERCSFPNSMVDCIVPATGPGEVALAESLGVADAAPVTHEDFRQWVVEDDFCAGRPDWEEAGVVFSDRVHDYEAMKIRILNAGHQVLANAGEILSLPTIADCMADPDVRALFGKVQADEIAPRVAPVPDASPEDYVRLVQRRFSNPAIRDTTRRVAFDGSSRHAGFVLPIVRDALAAGGPVEGLALVEALWARMCEGTREDGSAIAPNDPGWDGLQACAKAARREPRRWLEQERCYGDLRESGEFAGAFEAWLREIWSGGCRAALRRYSGAGG